MEPTEPTDDKPVTYNGALKRDLARTAAKLARRKELEAQKKKLQVEKDRAKARTGLRTKLSTAEAKNYVLNHIRDGKTIDQAMASVGYSKKSYEYWRKSDAGFVQAVDNARSFRTTHHEKGRPEAGTFEEFCRDYLKTPLYTHQLQWVDLLEGKDPRDVHPAITYEPRDKARLLINTPPNHAKTTTLTINYVVYRICKNPNIRIRLVSKTQEMAADFVYAVKQRLTHPKWIELQTAFAPEGGFKAGADAWQNTRFTIGAALRESGEKDPTLQGMGIGGQIYGSRCDLIIVDDAVTLANAAEHRKQIRWLRQEVASRLGPGGRLLVVGTRVDAIDLYSELRNGEHYSSGESPWTYFAQPAVLKFDDDPEKWETLWPKAQVPHDESIDERDLTADAEGLYPRWNGRHLYKVRGSLDQKTWAMVYMQAEVSEDAVFPQAVVNRAVNGMRRPGVMSSNQPGVRAQGMEGLYVIGSLDPASGAGDAAFIVYAYDRIDNKRYVLEARTKNWVDPRWIKDSIFELTDRYKVNEWVIEKNGAQRLIVQDDELTTWLNNRGILLTPHFTGNNKWDAGFGVASMSTLFDGGLIELPSTVQAEPIKQLIEQLVTWRPSRPGDEYKGKTDLVMALWFAEIRARALVQKKSQSSSFMRNRYLPASHRSRQFTVPASEFALQGGSEW